MNFVKRLIMLLVVIALLIGGFYYYMMKQAQVSTEYGQEQNTSLQNKKGNASITGLLVRRDNRYYIEPAQGSPASVDSNEMSLYTFEGERVTVTGQYSGDTLFVGKIEVEE